MTNKINFMQRAIQLAKFGQFTTSPNPNVGCVIVKNDEIIGEGWHQKAGTPHAEIHALNEAKDKAEGAEVFVTLEPCIHFGRTPPCVDALIKAKVSSVFVGMIDPNPLVAGLGIKKLQASGIQVESGLLESDCRKLNTGFIKRMEKKLPFVTCKLASSLDGATALSNGESKWITSAESRSDVQRNRAKCGAILSSANTVLADNPKLNVRWDELGSVREKYPEQYLRQPTRVIVDSKKRITLDLELFKGQGEIILATIDDHYDLVFPENVTTLLVDSNKGHVCLKALLTKLADLQINDIWMEAGASLSGAMLQQQLIDRFILYQAPKLMGNMTKPLFDFELEKLSDSVQLNILDVRQIGTDIKVTAKPLYRAQ